MGCKLMKILHIISNLGSGGAEKLIEEMVPIINEKENIRVDVLLLTDKNNVFDKKLKKYGIKLDVVPLRQPRNPINVYYLIKYIVQGGYDIVHAHLFPTIYWTSIASKIMFEDKPKFVMTEHSTHNRRREKSYLRYFEKYIYSSYDKIISISQQAQKNLISWLRPNQNELNKFVVINNGVDVYKFQNAISYKKSELCREFTEDTKLVCMVGRFSEAKDQPTLIKAMRNLTKDTHLLLVGDGPLREESERLAKDIGVGNRVHFLGFRNDVERILKTVDIVVLSSNWEGLSLASIEAMASGKPFVASRVPGLEEIVDGYGLLFEEGDSEELSKLINKLLNDNKLYEHISNKCLIRAKDFSIDNMVKSMISLYNKLI